MRLQKPNVPGLDWSTCKNQARFWHESRNGRSSAMSHWIKIGELTKLSRNSGMNHFALSQDSYLRGCGPLSSTYYNFYFPSPLNYFFYPRAGQMGQICPNPPNSILHLPPSIILFNSPNPSSFIKALFHRKHHNTQIACWWAKPQVHGFTEVVKIEYRSDKELWI